MSAYRKSSLGTEGMDYVKILHRSEVVQILLLRP